MTNPGNSIGTNGAYGGRTSVNALNDVLSIFDKRGILSGWQVNDFRGTIGGSTGIRDVAIARDNLGNSVTINNISGQPIQMNLPSNPTAGTRRDTVVLYVDNPPTGESTLMDNPGACGMIVISSDPSTTSIPMPTDEEIRSAITADGASGATAYYVVVASRTIGSNPNQAPNYAVIDPPKIKSNLLP